MSRAQRTEQGSPPDRQEPPPDAETDEYAQYHDQLAELASLPHEDPDRERLRDELIRNHIPLAKHIARRFRHRGVPAEDLQQVALLGLVNAIDRYQPDRGTDFLAFAVPTIMGEVRRYFRDTGWAMRVPRKLQELHLKIGKTIDQLSQQTGHAPTPTEIAEYLDVPRSEVQNGLQAANAYRTKSLTTPAGAGEGDKHPATETVGEDDGNIEHIEDRETLQPLLAELPERERQILTLRFYGNMTQTEIANRIGLSQMHISRLLTKTLQQLRDRIGE